MTLSQFSFLADENIDPSAISFLRNKSVVVSSLRELDLLGSSDDDILAYAEKTKQVILTQDSDFGSLIHTMDLEFYAIVFLRPGHFSPSIHMLKLENQLNPPFIIVADNSLGKIKIRVRDNIGN